MVYVQDEATLTGDTFDRDLKKASDPFPGCVLQTFAGLGCRKGKPKTSMGGGGNLVPLFGEFLRPPVGAFPFSEFVFLRGPLGNPSNEKKSALFCPWKSTGLGFNQFPIWPASVVLLVP